VSIIIVAYLLKARTVEPEKQPLLANGFETTFISRQRLGKHVPAATDTHATIEVLLETVFSTRQPNQLYMEVCEEKRQLEGNRYSKRTGHVKLENIHC
jgi:hypothetical protein